MPRFKLIDGTIVTIPDNEVDEFLSKISITDLVEKPRYPNIPLKEIKS